MVNKTKEISYKPQYGVIVICKSESHQKEVFEKMKTNGFKTKIVTV